jgi:probable DNA repair protein
MNTSLATLLAAAASGVPVVTVNKRLARYLGERFDRDRMQSGSAVWARPTILPYGVWLTLRLEDLGLAGSMLTSEQELHLWEEVIEEDLRNSGHALLQTTATARRASEAQHLLRQYRCDFSAADAGEDQRAFLRWRGVYRQRLAAAGWCDASESAGLVAAEAARLHWPQRLIFAGFDSVTPDLALLQEALRACGVSVEAWLPSVAIGTLGQYAAADARDEVHTCARWVRAILSANPDASIGVVAPQLSRYQPLIETVFRAELDPASVLAGDDVAAESFALSLGRSLAAEGVIRAALRLLDLEESISCDDLSWLLRSPYCAGAELERAARALADRELRSRRQRYWILPRLVQRLTATGNVPQFVALLRAFEAGRKRRQRTQTPGFWAEACADLLETVGWPGERALSSREFQAVHRFKGTLAELVSLDRVTAACSANEALSFLRRRAAETVFQPEGADGPVEVLGMLEASGQRFDYLWVLGLHEAALPSPARPHPFLPVALQRRLAMPHADAERELRYAEEIFARLCASAGEIVCSWPRQESGVSLRPSPFVASLDVVEPSLAESAAPAPRLMQARPQFEACEDAQAPALAPGQVAKGGTALIKDQALCPFRAFAHHRLHAEGLDSPDLGIDPLDRGTLIHGVLERFWQQTLTQAALLQLSPEDEAQRLQTAANDAVAHYERRERLSLPEASRRLESERLVRRGGVWLTVERTRPPFALEESEAAHQVPLGRLTIRTKVDRIDRLDDDRLAIIDYKTGQVDPAQWLDARLTEPQLPIYCRLLDHNRIGAVLFARVRAKAQECALRGLVRTPDDWPEPLRRAQAKLLAPLPETDFDTILRRWETTLHTLAEAFATGDAHVDPVEPRKTCAHCDLVPFCRIHDQRPEAGRGGDDE